VGNALFGGSAPSVALIFKDAGIENIFFIYVIFMLIICFSVVWHYRKNLNIWSMITNKINDSFEPLLFSQKWFFISDRLIKIGIQ
jgi:hypothetical protein